MRVSGKRVPFGCLLQPRRADFKKQFWALSRTFKEWFLIFKKPARETTETEKEKKEEGVRGTHINPVQGGKKNHHLSASDSGNSRGGETQVRSDQARAN